MENKCNNIGEKIYSLRKAKGFSQEDLADEIGLSVSTLKRIEGGDKGSYKLEYFEKIAKVLGVHLSKILPYEKSDEYRLLLQNVVDDEYGEYGEEEIEEMVRIQKIFYPNDRNEYEEKH